MVTVLRDRGLSKLVAGVEVATLAGGFQFTEGPLWCPDGALLFQDIKAERTYRLAPDGSVQILREATGAANGQTFASDGRVLFCEQNGRRVSRMNPDGTDVETVAESWQRHRLNSPNDIVCRSDGLAYFTDPPYGVKPEDRSIPFQGVYVIDNSGSVELLADDFEKPNGLAFSPDEQTLYVCDTGRYQVRAFDVAGDGLLRPGSGRIVATMDPGQPGGPDGMKVDREGRLYVAVALGVWVFDPDGRLLGILNLPKRPANLAWCGYEGGTLAITAVDSVYQVTLHVAGYVPVFLPPKKEHA